MGTATDVVGGITGKLLQLLALYAELDALKSEIQNDPPDDPAEYVALLTQLAVLADRIAALAKEVGSSSDELSPAEFAALKASIHTANQTDWNR